MARVLEVFDSRDGENGRVVKIRTKTGELIRPVQRLYPLEVTHAVDPVQVEERHVPLDADVNNISPKEVAVLPKSTRSGRVIRVPKRFL